MRTLLAALAALAVASLPLAASVAPAQRPISKSEIRTAPPEQTHRRLRDQLWSLIDREDLRREDPPRRALHRVHARTAPRGTEIPGLCRSDTLAIEFAPTGRRDRGADTPVLASGFTAASGFRFLRPPAGPPNEIEDYRRLPQDEPGCARLGDDVSFFEADDSEVATDGWFAFLDLQRGLRQDSPPELDCELHQNENPADCRTLILSFDQDDLREIERCDQPASGHWCTRLHVGDRRIDIYTAASSSHGPFGRAVRARLVSMIVMSHEAID